jgi:hypothetical protein
MAWKTSGSRAGLLSAAETLPNNFFMAAATAATAMMTSFRLS